MQTFPLPNCKVKCNRFSLETLLMKDSFFNSFPIHAIHLLIPGSEKLFESSKETLRLPDNTYFIVKNISIAALIQEAFITHFVKSGSLYAFSHEAKAELENFFTILPSGKLIMSLEATIADSLSLKKANPCHQKKKLKAGHQIYVIDMNSQDFLPGNKFYQTVLTELNKLEHIKFDLLLRWQPTENVCSQSITSFFESQGFDCDVCDSNQKHHCNFTVPIPKIDFSLYDSTMAGDVMEWIGSQICGIEYSEDSESFAGSFTVPQPSETLKKLQVGMFEGFYTREHICNLLEYIRKMFKVDSHLPFVAVSISGYQDCYVTANGYQKFSSDDKIISLVVSPALDCWVTTLNT